MKKSICMAFFLMYAFTGLPQCISLVGKVVDALTHKGIDATIYILDYDKVKVLGASDIKGYFSIKIPCNCKELTIKKPGFRSMHFPLSGNQGSYAVEIELYPTDKQRTNQPYFQSEQQDLVLRESASNSNKITIRHFKLIDIQSKTSLGGEICLIYTKTNKKDTCLIVANKAEGIKVEFQQEDIIGVVAKSEGYHTYNGQLIIDQIDGSNSAYEINLSGILSILAFSTNIPISSLYGKPEIYDSNGKKYDSIKMIDASHGYFILSTDQTYFLKIKPEKDGDVLETKIPHIRGIFFLPLLISKPLSATSTGTKYPDSKPTTHTRDSNLSIPNSPIIYFDQSSAILTEKATRKLDTIAVWMSQNSNAKAYLTGFTDNVGNSKKNLSLSEDRVKAVFNYLFYHGVKEKQLFGKALGGEYPAASNDNEETKLLNRRVEIKISN